MQAVEDARASASMADPVHVDLFDGDRLWRTSSPDAPFDEDIAKGVVDNLVHGLVGRFDKRSPSPITV